MTFETQFFGPGNRLRWAAISEGTISAEVQSRLGPFLADLQKDVDVLVLPCVPENNGRVFWYVLCATTHAARVARDELRAFLGPSYSDFVGRPTRLSEADPIDAAVIERCGKNAFKVEVSEERFFEKARERLLRLSQLRAQRPERKATRLRAAGRVLRDFEYSLLASDWSEAVDCLDELRSAGHLDGANLLFLEVRLLAAKSEWHAILALPQLDALIATVRPRRVTEAIISALYFALLSRFEAEGDAAAAVECFGRDILPRFRRVFASHAHLSGFAVDASFLLAAAAAEERRSDLSEEMLARYPEGAQRAYLEQIVALSSRPSAATEHDFLKEAREAFAVADLDATFELAQRIEVSFDQCALLLRCAQEMGTLASTQVALAAFGALDEETRARIENHAVLSRVLGSLQTFANQPDGPDPHASRVPSSWPDWLERLSEEVPWPGAVSVAEMGARQWDAASFVGDDAAINRMSELLLSERPAWGQTALRDALPYLLEFLLSAGPDARLRQLYTDLFLILALDDEVSLPQVNTLLRTADACLQIGVGEAAYADLVQQTCDAIDAIRSPVAANVGLEAIEFFVRTPCPSPAHRQDLLSRVAALFQRWYLRITKPQWALLRQFGEELGVEVEVREVEGALEEEVAIWRRLDGKRLAMYSLRESALRRVSSVVQSLCTGVRVSSFSDVVGGSASLRTAAESADLFVIATAAAKHAATEFIEANRPKSRPTAYARGQGSASLLEAIRGSLEKEGANLP